MLAPFLSQEAELHWLALKLVPGLGTRTAGRLIERFRTPEAVFRASRTELECAGVSGSVAQSIASGCTFEEATAEQQKMSQAGAIALTVSDPRYPQLLREVYDPPLVLYARGNVELLASPMLAMVGTRHPTPYGISLAERLAGDLAKTGLTIVSGMARGIDTAAHRGTLATGGNTIAVLGCGVDVVYPSENRRLATDLASKGLILSEFPMGSVAFPQNFPIRNRIISGMSYGVLVVEGAQYSGSGITARLALDQGRDVFAIPGNITSKMSWGPNLLIKQGAKLVQDVEDVIVELPGDVRRTLGTGPNATSGPAQASLVGSAETVGPVGRRALEKLQVDTALHLDNLLELLEDISPSELIAALFELEILGLIRQLPGKNFVKVW